MIRKRYPLLDHRETRKAERLREFFLSRGFGYKHISLWKLDNPLMEPHARRVMVNEAIKCHQIPHIWLTPHGTEAYRKGMNVRVNFSLPEERLRVIDADAEADHRDRTSMLQKIIAYYYDQHPQNGTTAPKKKAGAR